MLAARLTAIATGITVQAKNVADVWRTLAADDLVYDQEVVKASAWGPQFNRTAYTLQRKVAAVWTDAVSVTLDAGRGSSHWRADKFQIQGNSTNSSCALILTVAKGSRQVAHDLAVLKVMQTDVGGQFSYQSATYKGCFSSLERTSEPEMGGFQEGIDAQLVTDREQWALAGITPAAGQDVTWHDHTTPYRIVKVDTDEISFVLGLASVNR